MTDHLTRPRRSDSKLTVARALLVVAALAALGSGVLAITGLGEVSVDARMAETWRAVGLVFFGGVFVLLAWRPHGSGGLWLITLLSKIALTVVGVVYAAAGAASGAVASAAADGVLVVLLGVSAVLAGVWVNRSSATGDLVVRGDQIWS